MTGTATVAEMTTLAVEEMTAMANTAIITAAGTVMETNGNWRKILGDGMR